VSIYLGLLPGPWKGPGSLRFIIFTLNPPLVRAITYRRSFAIVAV